MKAQEHIVLHPTGAKKILDWVNANGVMPADWMLCDGIVDMQFDNYNKVTFKTDVSFTKDLNEKNDLSGSSW